MADEETARFIGGVQTRPVAWRGFLTMAGAWAMQGFAMFSVIEKSSGRWIGRLGPWVPEGWPGTEVGWGLAARRMGQGLRDRRRDGRDRLGVRDIWAGAK